MISVRLYLLLSHILTISLPPSACSNPLRRHPPPSSEGGEGAPAPCAEINCFGKEDSNERNPSGVSFVFVQVAFALQRRGEGAPAPCTELMPRNSFIVRRSYSPRRLVRYSAFRILHSAFRILHSAFRIICSKLRCCRREAPCRWRLRAGRFPPRKRCRRISSY